MREKPAALALARGLALPAIAYPAALFLGGIPAALVALAVLAGVLTLAFFFAFSHEETAQSEALAIRGAVATVIHPSLARHIRLHNRRRRWPECSLASGATACSTMSPAGTAWL